MRNEFVHPVVTVNSTESTYLFQHRTGQNDDNKQKTANMNVVTIFNNGIQLHI